MPIACTSVNVREADRIPATRSPARLGLHGLRRGAEGRPAFRRLLPGQRAPSPLPDSKQHPHPWPGAPPSSQPKGPTEFLPLCRLDTDRLPRLPGLHPKAGGDHLPISRPDEHRPQFYLPSSPAAGKVGPTATRPMQQQVGVFAGLPSC